MGYMFLLKGLESSIFSYVCDKRRKSILVFLNINCCKNTKGITLTIKVTCMYQLASAIITDILILVSLLFTRSCLFFRHRTYRVTKGNV